MLVFNHLNRGFIQSVNYLTGNLGRGMADQRSVETGNSIDVAGDKAQVMRNQGNRDVGIEPV
jgi:hypothetical protein